MLRKDKLRNMAHLHNLIKFYFMLGLRHGKMLLFLSAVDDNVISMPKLGRILKCMGLYRMKNEPNTTYRESDLFFLFQKISCYNMKISCYNVNKFIVIPISFSHYNMILIRFSLFWHGSNTLP